MTPSRWQRVKVLYEAASGLEPHEWESFLAAACAGDEQLAAEIRELLQNSGSGSVLDRPLLSLGRDAAKAPVFEAGQIAAGRFEILSLLGSGGMGEVYEAFDRELKEQVALKTLRSDLSDVTYLVEKLRQEARRSRRVSNPHVCRVYDIFSAQAEASAPLFLTMQLLRGPTLASVLSRKGRLPAEVALALARQMLAALAAAHEAGILHRDFKPSNIVLVDYDGRSAHVVVTDFGLAIEQTGPGGPAAEASMTIAGTPDYMAPERFRGVTTTASDLYSFGVVLFEMLTGSKTRDRDSEARLPPAPRLKALVTRCLEADPAKRFGSAQEIIEDLDALGHAAVREPFWKAGRRWIWAGLAGMALLGAGGMLVQRASRPLPLPRLGAAQQITADGISKIRPLLSDGSRLLFNSSVGPRQVSVTGGATLPLEVAVQDAMVEAISPDRTEMLLCRYNDSTDGCELWICPAVGGAARRVGNALARHGAADWSPDGQRVAYAKGRNLYIITREGNLISRIEAGAGEPNWVGWSPDGKRLRFMVAGNPRGSMWDAFVDGSRVAPALENWNNSWFTCCGSWTADGSYFLFAAGRDGHLDWNIWALRERGGGAGRLDRRAFALTSGPLATNWPVASPDGKHIFVDVRQPRNEFLLYEPETRQFRTALEGLSGTDLEFSRDGKWAAFVAVPDGVLWRSAADGKDRLRLAPGLRAHLPHWSRDGRQIAFSAAPAGGRESVYVVNADGSGLTRLTDGKIGAGGERDATWTADGSSLLFGQTWPDAGSSRTLHLLDLKSNRIRTLEGSDGLWSPRCSPDGKLAAAIAEPGSRIVVYDLKTRKREQVSRLPSGYPSWSEDGRELYYRTATGVAWWRYRMRDRKTEQIASFAERPPTEWFAPAPHRRFVTAREAGTDEIYSIEWSNAPGNP